MLPPMNVMHVCFGNSFEVDKFNEVWNNFENCKTIGKVDD